MRRALVVAVTIAAFVWCLRPMWDMDVFWHVTVGRLILDEGIPRTDLLSAAHPEAPWVTFQWLYEALLARVDGAFGLRGLQVLHAGVLALSAGLAFGLALRRSGEVMPAFSAWMLGLLLLEDRVRERPHVFEVLFIVAMLPFATGRADGLAIGAVALAGLWANLHAVSALWWLALAGAWALTQPKRWPYVLAGVAVMLASPPAREGLLGALASHRSWPSELVPELRSTWTYVHEGWWGAVMLGGVGLGMLAALERLRRPGWEERLVALGCGVAALLIARWAWLAAVPIGLWLTDPERKHKLHLPLALACALALGARVGPRWPLEERFEVLQRRAFPVAACDFLAERGLALPMDAYPQWSGYALYRLHPPLRVLVDGRLVFGPDVAELILRRFQGDISTFDEAVARFHTVLLLWPTDNLPERDPERWKQLYADDVASVWVAKPAWERVGLR